MTGNESLGEILCSFAVSILDGMEEQGCSKVITFIGIFSKGWQRNTVSMSSPVNAEQNRAND